jgi:glutaminyl-peptide cyclotransferase
MTRTAVAAGLIVVLAACFGASLARRPQTAGAAGASAAQDERPIDQNATVAVDPVRAPADLGQRALDHVKAIVTYGARHSGTSPTPGWSRQLDYITGELQKQGLEPVRDAWTEEREGIAFTNVSATIRGRRPERIVIACHHDTKCTQGHADPTHNFEFVGANDGGSGVGLLLALAPLLAQPQRDATIELVFFDGEESLDWDWNEARRALFGSKRHVRRQRDAELKSGAPRIAAMVLLDMVGRTDLHIQEELFSTPRLRTIVWSAAKACGHQAQFFRNSQAASDDHKPYLDVGIPAVDLIDLVDNPNWHKATDTVGNLSAASLQRVGEVVLTALPLIEREYVLDRH